MEILLYILLAIQVLSAFVLIGLVLIHSPKGDGVAGIGGAAQLFSSPKGAESGLNQITYWTMGVFFLTSFITGYYGHLFISTQK